MTGNEAKELAITLGLLAAAVAFGVAGRLELASTALGGAIGFAMQGRRVSANVAPLGLALAASALTACAPGTTRLRPDVRAPLCELAADACAAVGSLCTAAPEGGARAACAVAAATCATLERRCAAAAAAE